MDFSAEQRTELTFRYERRRAVTAGIVETASTTFLLLIAVRWFHTGPTAKWLIASGGSLGFLLSPAVVSFVARRSYRTSQAAAAFSAFSACCFFFSAFCGAESIFVAASLFGVAALSAIIPLYTQFYQENYPALKRGQLFSRTTVIRIFSAGLFGWGAGYGLSGHIEYYRWLQMIFGLSMTYAAYCFSKIPSGTLPETSERSLREGLGFVKTDAVFRNTLICWMIMGFGNLMMQPLRVEYLANPRYGLALSENQIAFLVAVIPSVARLVISPVWGKLFDRMNFFAMRSAANIGFMFGIVAFFCSGSFTGLVLGSIVFGIANAGGEIAWNLWVTKFAPPQKVASYMATHVFLTGIRGLAAPFVAFHLATVYSLPTIGAISAVLIVGSNLWLIPAARHESLAQVPAKA